MDFGERTTGTRDEHYNLISVLYHALHGAENCDRYASDAEIAGVERLAAFFREAQGMQTQLAERAKDMLGIGEPYRREVFEVPPEGMVAQDTPPGAPPEDLPPRAGPEVPPESDVGPGATPGDVRRGTTPDAPITPPEEGVPPDVASPPDEERLPREEPPPGEERPERRGAAPTTAPIPREEPPAGEERPGRRTP